MYVRVRVCLYTRMCVYMCVCVCVGVRYPNAVTDTTATLLDVKDMEAQLHAVEDVSHERPPTADVVGVVSREVG